MMTKVAVVSLVPVPAVVTRVSLEGMVPAMVFEPSVRPVTVPGAMRLEFVTVMPGVGLVEVRGVGVKPQMVPGAMVPGIAVAAVTVMPDVAAVPLFQKQPEPIVQEQSETGMMPAGVVSPGVTAEEKLESRSSSQRRRAHPEHQQTSQTQGLERFHGLPPSAENPDLPLDSELHERNTSNIITYIFICNNKIKKILTFSKMFIFPFLFQFSLIWGIKKMKMGLNLASK
ncbi:MAG: hypothetical protein GWN38_16940 [Nitrospinaceae bacterium]|nr:hypothetical protein [Nitrospinaceae bacterium]